MYDIIAIGNPQYNLVLSQSNDPILSGPSVNISSVAASFGINRLALVGAIGPKYRERFITELDAHRIPEHLIIESARTTEFQIACTDEGIQSQILLESAGPIKIKDIPDEFLRSELIVLAPVFNINIMDCKLIGCKIDYRPTRSCTNYCKWWRNRSKRE